MDSNGNGVSKDYEQTLNIHECDCLENADSHCVRSKRTHGFEQGLCPAASALLQISHKSQSMTFSHACLLLTAFCQESILTSIQEKHEAFGDMPCLLEYLANINKADRR